MPQNNARILYMRESVKHSLDKIWEYPLTVVEAPMGYGKTTAVKEYLKNSKAQVLWHTLVDNSATVFWHSFSRLLGKLGNPVADGLAEVGVPSNSVFLEEAVRIVGNMEFPVRTVIVLDDYHLLSSADVDKFIELLVKCEYSNLHIVIVSRSVFGENTTELALKGYCWLIDKSCFELSRDEIVEYCRLCGVKLNTEETNFLLSYTEGWISAVYLCILDFLQGGRIERQASLNELIEKVVYRRCSAVMQEFLLKICIFDSFSLAQAEYMWRKEDAESLLRQLVAENAFIKHDRVNRRYHIHNIFTSYLRRIFDRQGLDRRQDVWRAAGKWHASIGDCSHAMDYFYQAGDFNDLLTTIEIDKGSTINNEHKERLIRYFSDCPTEIKRKHPWACLIYAINLFSFNEMELFAQQCKEIGSLLEDSPGMDDQTRAKLAGELEILCSFAKYNHIPGMSEHHQRACDLLQGPAEFIDRHGSWTFGSPSVLYMFYRESGQLAQAVQEMNTALPIYCRLTDGHGCGAEYVMQAEGFYYSGDFENAEIAAHKAMHSAKSQEQVSIVLCALFLQLRLALVKGNLAYVLGVLQRTREELKQKGLYAYIHTWDMCEGFIYSYLNRGKKIPAWIVNDDVQDSSIFFPSYAFLNIIRGKALLIEGQYPKLVGIAEAFVGIASVFPNLLGQVYTYIFEAAAKFKLGRHEDARETLRKALDIAAPDQVMMPFVENGEYIADMLMVLEKNGHYGEFIGRIREIFPAIVQNREAMSAELNSVDNKSKLTEREWVIAELIATGLSNRAAGERLYIAEVTVKKALQSIYAKLGISNRSALTKIVIEQQNS